MTTTKTVNTAYVFITFLAVVATWEIHEFAHWLAGRILGYQMAMTLNKSYSLQGTTAAHAQIISGAGPLVTLGEAVLVFILMDRSNRRLLYPFLFTCFYCRLLAALISFRNLNDEARISKFLRIGTFTLPLLMTAALFFCCKKFPGNTTLIKNSTQSH